MTCPFTGCLDVYKSLEVIKLRISLTVVLDFEPCTITNPLPASSEDALQWNDVAEGSDVGVAGQRQGTLDHGTGIGGVYTRHTVRDQYPV